MLNVKRAIERGHQKIKENTRYDLTIKEFDALGKELGLEPFEALMIDANNGLLHNPMYLGVDIGYRIAMAELKRKNQ